MSNGNWRCPNCNAAGVWTDVGDEKVQCDNCGRIYTKQFLSVRDLRDKLRLETRKK